MTDDQIRAAFETWWAELHRRYPNATLETPGHMPEPMGTWHDHGMLPIAEVIEGAFEAGFKAGRGAER